MTDIDSDARIIWDYMLLHEELKKCDAIFVFGSMDTRVAERGAELFKQGLGDTIIISGGKGRFTKDAFEKTEAETFAEIMRTQGIPADKLLLETKGANTGENIEFTYQLLKERGLEYNSLLLVQKPYMERRTYATFKKQWPGSDVDIQITSPQISYDDYFTDDLPKDFVINVMVGDLQRIREYPKLGFQIEQEIPYEVWQAYERLIAAGFTKHLIKP